MSEKITSRLNSAKAIDDLLSLTERRHSPNWLLTYIDVFVLIVMLVVTLVSLSSFETPEPQFGKSVEPLAKPPAVEEKIEPDTTIPEISKATPTEIPDTIDLLPTHEDEAELIVEDELLAAIEEDAVIPTDAPEPKPEAAPEADDVQQEEARIQQQLSQQLRQLGLDDSINMSVTQGYAQLEIQDNILYKSSEASLTKTGQTLLTRLTPLLKQAQGLIYIEGHTDNRPINTPQFPSNWELGAARATSVLHFLASQDIDATRMRAVTYADTQPIADNETEEGRQKNRRVNIIIKVSDQMDRY